MAPVRTLGGSHRNKFEMGKRRSAPKIYGRLVSSRAAVHIGSVERFYEGPRMRGWGLARFLIIESS